MGVGALVLLVATLLAGQSIVLPVAAGTWAAVGYLVVLGSATLFMLFLYVIERWTASATSYSLLLMPLPAAVGGALLLGEPITIGLVFGGALIMLGVYFGAFAPSLAVPLPGLFRRPTPATAGAGAEMTAEPPSLINPGCP
jgi:drug/metabolite transporter (DMT)-like permease